MGTNQLDYNSCVNSCYYIHYTVYSVADCSSIRELYIFENFEGVLRWDQVHPNVLVCLSLQATVDFTCPT